MVIFHSYVSLPEGNSSHQLVLPDSNLGGLGDGTRAVPPQGWTAGYRWIGARITKASGVKHRHRPDFFCFDENRCEAAWHRYFTPTQMVDANFFHAKSNFLEISSSSHFSHDKTATANHFSYKTIHRWWMFHLIGGGSHPSLGGAPVPSCFTVRLGWSSTAACLLLGATPHMPKTKMANPFERVRFIHFISIFSLYNVIYIQYIYIQ